MSALLVNPYRTDKDFKISQANDCYERRTLYELLEQICTKYLLIVHEVVYNGERCFLFTRFTETGTYKVYDILDDDILCPYGQEGRKVLLFQDHACFVEGEYIGQYKNPETKNQLPTCN